MTKKLLSLVVALLLITSISAQSIQEREVKIGNFYPKAYSVILVQDEDVVKDALKQYLKNSGYKTSKSEGYQAVLDKVISEIYSSGKINFYTKIESHGRKKNRTIEVTFVGITADLTGDATQIARGTRQYLERFAEYVPRYEAEQKLADAEKRLGKATKESNRANDDVADYEKQQKKYEEKIAKLQKEVDEYQQKIDERNRDIQAYQNELAKINEKKVQAEKKANSANEAKKAVETEAEGYRQQLKK